MIFKKIQQILKEELDIDESNITLKTSFKEDLGLDSLAIIGISQIIEEEFNLKRIEDEDLSKFKTVENVVTFIQDLI